MYFCWLCETHGIKVYCDTSIIVPHLRIDAVGPDHWAGFMQLQQAETEPHREGK
jgi:hypothetical protein